MKKLIAIILAFTLLFSFTALPASAELGTDTGVNINSAKSIFERIADVFHDLVAKLFKVFGMECPLCENHDGYGEAEGDGGFNKAEVAKKYNDAVNALKAYDRKVTVEYIKDRRPTLVQAPGTLNKKVENILKEYKIINDLTTRNFERNQSKEITKLLPPSDRESQLSGNYLKYIKPLIEGDNTKIEFEFEEAVSKYENAVTTAPNGYSEAFDYINLAEYEFDGISLEKAEITYKDAKVEALLDGYERVTYIKVQALIVIKATVVEKGAEQLIEVELSSTDTYNIIYK